MRFGIHEDSFACKNVEWDNPSHVFSVLQGIAALFDRLTYSLNYIKYVLCIIDYILLFGYILLIGSSSRRPLSWRSAAL